MRLSRVVVDRWRGFSEACIDFSPDGFTVLTGPNNAGKSLLLQAAEQAAAGNPLDENGQAAAVWEIDSEEDLPRANRPGSARYFDADVCGLVRVLTEGGETGFVLLRREVAAGLTPIRSLPIFHAELAAVPVRNGGGPSDGLLVQSSTSSGQSVTDSVSTELIERMRELSTSISYRLPTIRPGSERTIPAEATLTLAPDGSNLPHVLLWLQTRDGAGWRKVREFFESVFPNAGRLLAKVSAQEVEIVLSDPETGQDRNLKDLGTGLEQLVLVAVACETQPPGSLVIVDEPEIGLHPGAQRVLAQRLHAWATDRRVLVASHSPVFLSESRSAGRVHIVTRTAGSATVTAVTEAQTAALRELGATAADAIGVDRFLVVEGPSDRHVVETLFADVLLAGRIGIIEANGGTRVRPVATVVEGLAPAFDGKVFGVVDSDEDPPSSRPDLHVLPCREIENLFLSIPAAIQEALRRRSVEVEELQVIEATDAAIEGLRLDALWLAVAASLRRSVALAPLRFQRRGAAVDLGSGGFKQLRDQGISSLPDDATIDQAWEHADGRFEDEWPSNKLNLVRGSKALDAVFRNLSSGTATYEKTRDLQLLAEAIASHPDSWPEALRALGRAIAAFATSDVRWEPS